MFKRSLIKTLILVIFSIILIHAQEDNRLNNLRQKFESFQYENVITGADSLLKGRDTLSEPIVIEIYLMKGISHFSLQQVEPAKKSFTEVLKLDSSINLDSAKTSPRIIAFFNDTRENYLLQLSQTSSPVNKDTVYIYKGIPDPETEMNFKNTFLRSIILPGWGHLYNGNSTKGTILTSLSALTIISSVYFIFDANTKKDNYNNTTNINLISKNYDKYNTSYNLRNYSLIAFAAVWIYAQLDLLLFSDNSYIPEETIGKTELSFNPGTGFSLNYHFSF